VRILLEGALLAAGVLSAFLWAVWQNGSGPRATTIAFVAIVLIHPFQAMHCRSLRTRWWRLPVNPLSWMALAALVALQWIAVSYPSMNRLLGTERLALADWALVGAAVLWPVAIGETAKAWGWLGPLGRARPIRPGCGSGGRGQSLRNP